MDDFDHFLPAMMGMMIPIVAIIGAFVFIIVKTLAKARVRELEIKERIAMIDRGLVPPPEVDPRGFEHALHRVERGPAQAVGNRSRRLGITMIGIGFGLMLMISFAGESPAQGLGIGGFLVVLGLAFLVNGLFDSRQGPSELPRAYGASPTPANGRPSDSVPPS